MIVNEILEKYPKVRELTERFNGSNIYKDKLVYELDESEERLDIGNRYTYVPIRGGLYSDPVYLIYFKDVPFVMLHRFNDIRRITRKGGMLLIADTDDIYVFNSMHGSYS